MITIGYGDITPTTIYEKIFVIFVSFIASGIFAYAIVNIIRINKLKKNFFFCEKNKIFLFY